MTSTGTGYRSSIFLVGLLLAAACTAPGGDASVESLAPAAVETARQALFVVGSTTLGPGDTMARNRLQHAGFTVTVKAASAAVTSDASGKALVVISSTVSSTAVGTKFRNVAVPVVLWEPFLLDDMGMATTSGTVGGSSIAITMPSHPLAVYRTGTVSVALSADTLTWGTPNANAFKVATVPGNSSQATIFAYEPGATMPGLAAPARRVALFLFDNTANNLTSAGWSFFDKAILWAAAPFPAAVTTEKALILIDERLYITGVGPKIDQYRSLVQQRRGFGVALHVIDGVDEWRHDYTRGYLKQQRNGAPGLEGVLFVGNIKVPSFFQSRTDSADTRLIPRYYEDLDGVFSKRLTDGAPLPLCPEPYDGSYNCFRDQINVPPHDFDFVAKGPAPDPEIWTSYMPVGGVGSDSYDDFANQLGPYLDKVIRHHSGALVGNGRFYYMGTGLGEEPEKYWNAYGKTRLDLYGRPGPNGEKGSDCIKPDGSNVCYRRWDTENYADAATFFAAANAAIEGLGDVWWQKGVFIGHLNAAVYDIVDYAVHSWETESLVTSAEAAAITGGGLIIALSGCGVGGYLQPGSPSYVNTSATAATNIMLSFLYGASQATSVLGDPFWRGHYAKYPSLYLHMKTTPGSYLGRANLARLKELYQISTDDGGLRENGMEMLTGDPFVAF